MATAPSVDVDTSCEQKNSDQGAGADETTDDDVGRQEDEARYEQEDEEERRREIAEKGSVGGRRLGGGSFGNVYVRRDDPRSVVKRPLPPTPDDAVTGLPGDAIREASAYALLAEHRLDPHLPTRVTAWYDDADATLCIGMRRYAYTLRQLYAIEPELFLDTGGFVRASLYAILRQVRDLERAGLAHRDLKPDNILVTRRRRRMCVGDLGMTRPMHVWPTLVGAHAWRSAKAAAAAAESSSTDVASSSSSTPPARCFSARDDPSPAVTLPQFDAAACPSPRASTVFSGRSSSSSSHPSVAAALDPSAAKDSECRTESAQMSTRRSAPPSFRLYRERLERGQNDDDDAKVRRLPAAHPTQAPLDSLTASRRAPPKQLLTGEVQTMWYRDPRLILGADGRYTAGIDMWSFGCIAAEMLAHPPVQRALPSSPEVDRVLFRSPTQLEHLLNIFTVLGTPDERSWPGVSRLAHYSPHFPRWSRVLERQLWLRTQHCRRLESAHSKLMAATKVDANATATARIFSPFSRPSLSPPPPPPSTLPSVSDAATRHQPLPPSVPSTAAAAAAATAAASRRQRKNPNPQRRRDPASALSSSASSAATGTETKSPCSDADRHPKRAKTSRPAKEASSSSSSSAPADDGDAATKKFESRQSESERQNELAELQLVDLISRILQLDPRRRLTADAALAHEFFAPCRDAEKRTGASDDDERDEKAPRGTEQNTRERGPSSAPPPTSPRTLARKSPRSPDDDRASRSGTPTPENPHTTAAPSPSSSSSSSYLPPTNYLALLPTKWLDATKVSPARRSDMLKRTHVLLARQMRLDDGVYFAAAFALDVCLARTPDEVAEHYYLYALACAVVAAKAHGCDVYALTRWIAKFARTDTSADDDGSGGVGDNDTGGTAGEPLLDAAPSASPSSSSLSTLASPDHRLRFAPPDRVTSDQLAHAERKAFHTLGFNAFRHTCHTQLVLRLNDATPAVTADERRRVTRLLVLASHCPDFYAIGAETLVDRLFCAVRPSSASSSSALSWSSRLPSPHTESLKALPTFCAPTSTPSADSHA